MMAVRDAFTLFLHLSFSQPKSLHLSVVSLPLSLLPPLSLHSCCVHLKCTLLQALLHNAQQHYTAQLEWRPALQQHSQQFQQSVFRSATVCTTADIWRDCSVITRVGTDPPTRTHILVDDTSIFSQACKWQNLETHKCMFYFWFTRNKIAFLSFFFFKCIFSLPKIS